VKGKSFEFPAKVKVRKDSTTATAGR